MVSVWTLVVITADRYVAVCLPGQARLRTVRHAKLAVVCVAVIAAVCCVPLFVERKADSTLSPLKCDDHDDATQAVAVNQAPSVARSWWLTAYQILCDCLIRTAIPFVILVILISGMMGRVRQMTGLFHVTSADSNTPHQQLQRKKKANKKMNWRKSLTMTLVAVVALFVGCQLPQLVLRVSVLLPQLSARLHLNDKILQQTNNVASGLLVVNATANFFVYCVVGNNFRRVLLKMFSCRLAKKTAVSPEQENRKNDVELAGIPKPAKPANK